ncbi:MAG: hypothetical protein ACLGPL_10095, partial [Acidobacteriota bacterium]
MAVVAGEDPVEVEDSAAAEEVVEGVSRAVAALLGVRVEEASAVKVLPRVEVFLRVLPEDSRAAEAVGPVVDQGEEDQ